MAGSDKDSVCRRYRLHGSPDSANFVVRMVLEELRAEYDYVPVDRRASEQKSETYRRLNPQGLIPVLEVPGQDAPLFETGAIILFLTDRRRALAPAEDAPQRGRFLKWLLFLSNTLHSDLRIAFKPERYLPGGATNAAFRETLVQRFAQGFSYLDQEIADQGGIYILGDRFSCLDIYLAACARWAQVYGLSGRWDLTGTPHLRRMLEALETRTAIRKACDLELIEGAPFTDPRPVTLPGITT